VDIIGLYDLINLCQIERAIRFKVKRLRLDAAKHGGAAGFVMVCMGHLADDVFISPLAVAHNGDQVALRAA